MSSGTRLWIAADSSAKRWPRVRGGRCGVDINSESRFRMGRRSRLRAGSNSISEAIKPRRWRRCRSRAVARRAAVSPHPRRAALAEGLLLRAGVFRAGWGVVVGASPHMSPSFAAPIEATSQLPNSPNNNQSCRRMMIGPRRRAARRCQCGTLMKSSGRPGMMSRNPPCRLCPALFVLRWGGPGCLSS